MKTQYSPEAGSEGDSLPPRIQELQKECEKHIGRALDALVFPNLSWQDKLSIFFYTANAAAFERGASLSNIVGIGISEAAYLSGTYCDADKKKEVLKQLRLILTNHFNEAGKAEKEKKKEETKPPETD